MMKRFIIPIALPFIGLFFICCTSSSRCKVVQMRCIESADTFSISQLCEESFDSFYVVPPYYNEDFESNTFSISNEMKDDIVRRLRQNDDACVLLLSRNNMIQVYSVIFRNDADFSKLEHLKGISTKEKLILNPKREVAVTP